MILAIIAQPYLWRFSSTKKKNYMRHIGSDMRTTQVQQNTTVPRHLSFLGITKLTLLLHPYLVPLTGGLNYDMILPLKQTKCRDTLLSVEANATIILISPTSLFAQAKRTVSPLRVAETKTI